MKCSLARCSLMVEETLYLSLSVRTNCMLLCRALLFYMNSCLNFADSQPPPLFWLNPENYLFQDRLGPSKLFKYRTMYD